MGVDMKHPNGYMLLRIKEAARGDKIHNKRSNDKKVKSHRNWRDGYHLPTQVQVTMEVTFVYVCVELTNEFLMVSIYIVINRNCFQCITKHFQRHKQPIQ